MKTRILVCLIILGSLLSLVTAAPKKSVRAADPRIVKIYNDFSHRLKVFELNAKQYTYADSDEICGAMESIAKLQRKAYIAIKQIDSLQTQYTSQTIYDSFATLNKIGLGTLNSELDNIHQSAQLWDNNKRAGERATSSENLMNWNSMSDRLLLLWNIFYSWDNNANAVVQRTELYPTYCLLSTSMRHILADHKLALQVLFDSWKLNKANPLSEDYKPLKYETQK